MISQNINLWTRLRRWLGGVSDVRKFKAAQKNRLQKNWTTSNASANYDIRQSLHVLRARSREECQNNPLFKKYLSLARSNIIGSAPLQLQVRAQKTDSKTKKLVLHTKLNKIVENLWWDFCDRDTFSASGKLSFWAMLRLVVTSVAKDGEVLIQIINADNKFGMSVKVISADYLDENLNRNSSNGNRIIMGVEVDNNNRPIAYHLRTPPTNRMFVRADAEPVRIPANQMLHVFLPLDDEEAVRGVPWFYATLVKAKYLNELQNSVLLNNQVAASTLGFIKKDMPDEGAIAYEGETGETAPLTINYEPASFTELDAGMSIEKFDPGQPTDNHAEHVKIVQGEIATGNDVNYFELTGDLSEVNFSSARIGLNASRDVWRELQTWMGETVCTPIYHEFVRRAFLNGLLQITPREFQEIQRPVWRGRGWEYIEPMKDVQSDLLAIAGGIKTRTQVLADRGEDITDFLETAKGERKEIDDAELEFSATGKDSGSSSDTSTDDSADDTTDTTTKKKDKKVV